MTKDELKKSHDTILKLLVKLCRYSDETWGGRRSDRCEAHYKEARRLIRKAGIDYEPKKP